MSKIKNPYLNYSMPTLEILAQEFANKLGFGQTTLGNGDNLGEAYEQVLEAIEQRTTTDFCQHGVFLYGDVSPACWQCESGE
jgi:hypothetical protein